MDNAQIPAQSADNRSSDCALANDAPIKHVRESLDIYPRLINGAGVTLPLAGLVVAICLLWGVAFFWQYLVIVAVMYLLTGFGITIGYHRLFTHRSFKTPKPVAATLAILGSMAVEGPLLHWVAVHRKHHQFSDDHGDPHSPHHHGAGLVATLRGMWHAHIGWSLGRRLRFNMAHHVRDLSKDRTLLWISRLFPLWAVLGLIIPAVAGGLWTMTWTGVLLGFIWGGLVRVLLIHHVTWSINSVCHLWGSRPYDSDDHSRNNPVFGILALGEGWHNNHHAFPTSARHGLRWWQFDASYLVIRLMERIGLASDVRVPTYEKQQERKRKTADSPTNSPRADD